MPEQIILKTCRICKQTKPLSEFYEAAGNRDGFSNRCKICQATNQKHYRQSEKGKAVIKHYFQSKKGKTVLKRCRQSEKGKMIYKRYRQSEKGKATLKRRQQTENYKICHNRYAKRYTIHHPEQTKAHDAVNNAIRDGRLPQLNSLQCHYCPAQAKQYHHHKGYEPEHYLDVIPVCIKCHNEIPKNPAKSIPSLTA